MIAYEMEHSLQQLMKKADRLFVAIDRGDRSQRRYAQLAKLQQELEALMPNELPPFLRKIKSQ